MQYFISVFALVLGLNGFGQTISDARKKMDNEIVTVKGTVLNSPNDIDGIVVYIQDATAGIAIYDNTWAKANPNLKVGDEVQVTGVLVDFNSLLEVTSISSSSIISTNNPLPTPLQVSVNQLNESFEGRLIQISNGEFVDAGQMFAERKNYSLLTSNGSAQIRTNRNSNYNGIVIPSGKVNVIAIVSQFNTTYQILPRTKVDIIPTSSFVFSVQPKQGKIEKTSLEFSWETNINADKHILLFGRNNTNSEVTIGTNSTNANGVFPTEAGTIYQVKAAAILGIDTIFSKLMVVGSQSNSLGVIEVLFNDAVDNSVDPIYDAVSTKAFAQIIADLINNATQTVDVAAYNNDNSVIVNALNAAHARGVMVRYVACSTTQNRGLQLLNPAIGLLKADHSGIMHNKFIIVDRNDVMKAKVLTGSTNHTPDQLVEDPNHIIIVQDQTLAQAYTIEFEEMFGSQGNQPDLMNSKTGSKKTDNTPHLFNINGKLVESYFSPSDRTSVQIEKALNSVDTDASFGLLTFTRNEFGTALVNKHKAGKSIRGIIENINDSGSEYDFLVSNGVKVKPHTLGTQFHHKYVIVDYFDKDSDPLVVTGSHNWSSSAEERNDENTLIVHDFAVVAQFQEEFEARWTELPAVGLGFEIEDSKFNRIKVIGNRFNIKERVTKVYDMLGRRVEFTQENNIVEMDTRGVYILEIE